MTVKWYDGGVPNGGGSEKLVARFIHSGNQEFYIASADWSTATLTLTAPHGLAGATQVLVRPNYADLTNPSRDLLSIPMEWIKPQGVANNTANVGLALLPVNATTVQVVKATDNTTAIPVNLALLENNNTNVDVSKFHFEVPISWEVAIPNLKKFRFHSKGYVKQTGSNSAQYRYKKLKYLAADGSLNDAPLHVITGFVLQSNPYAGAGVFVVENWIYDLTSQYTKLELDNFHGGRRAGYAGMVFDTLRENNHTWLSFTKIPAGCTLLGTYSPAYAYHANGTLIEIYDLEG